MKNFSVYIKSAAALVTAAAAALTLTGCGLISFNHAKGGNDETSAGETTYAGTQFEVVDNSQSYNIDSFLSDLSGADYGGGAAKIVSAKSSLIIPDESTSAVMSKECEERNAAVCDKLKISVTSVQADPDIMHDEILAANKSGSYYADLVMIPQSYIGAFAADGALINLRSLPGLELDRAYLGGTGVAAGTGGDAVYAAAGAASLNGDSLSAIYYNRALLSTLGLGSPENLVDSGNWTVDKYLEYTAALSSLDGEWYTYGAQNASPYLCDLLYFASGARLTESAVGSYPAIAMTGDGTGAVLEKIFSIVNDGKAYGNAVTAIDGFGGGNVLFLFERLSSLGSLSHSNTDWGLLPLPKYDAAQSTYCSLAYYEDAYFFGAVPTVSNVEMSSDLLTAINIMSYGYTADAYVKNASYYYLRENDSIRMLDYIVKGAVYDFAYSFADSNKAIPSATFMAVRNTVGGVSSLERYLDMWTGQFNNAMYRLFDTEG